MSSAGSGARGVGRAAFDLARCEVGNPDRPRLSEGIGVAATVGDGEGREIMEWEFSRLPLSAREGFPLEAPAEVDANQMDREDTSARHG
jgi:hypothetical protein